MVTQETVGGVAMPRSVEAILQHTDQLAARFESHALEEPHEIEPRAELRLQQAALVRGNAERHLIEAVVAARTSGLSWATIGQCVGTSGEAARQRYVGKLNPEELNPDRCWVRGLPLLFGRDQRGGT